MFDYLAVAARNLKFCTCICESQHESLRPPSPQRRSLLNRRQILPREPSKEFRSWQRDFIKTSQIKLPASERETTRLSTKLCMVNGECQSRTLLIDGGTAFQGVVWLHRFLGNDFLDEDLPTVKDKLRMAGLALEAKYASLHRAFGQPIPVLPRNTFIQTSANALFVFSDPEPVEQKSFIMAVGDGEKVCKIKTDANGRAEIPAGLRFIIWIRTEESEAQCIELVGQVVKAEGDQEWQKAICEGLGENSLVVLHRCS